MTKTSSLIFRVLKRTCIVVLGLVIVVFILLLYLSPGTTSPIVDANGHKLPSSIAVIEQPVINGVRQSLIIRGENKDNPVLLFVHGGPGISAFPFIKDEFKGMEKSFTICYWDQRGAGKSYSTHMPAESMTPDQLTNDGIAVSRYLLKKFHKQKIYILGHSWGTFLASYMIHKNPELYYAYIGIGQVANNYLSEQMSYQFVVAEAHKRNDLKAIRELKQLKVPSPESSAREWVNYVLRERTYVYRYGGSRYGKERSVVDLAKQVLLCKEFTIADKLTFNKAVNFSMIHLYESMIQKNPCDELTEQQVPVFIFQGIHDHQTDFVVAKDYFDHLKAPLKRFYAFEHSSHSPHVEEYDAFEKIVRMDVLGRKE